ncbi:MAG: hypothetical protein HY658_10225 [Actinobacteria bacterium]|nr:hypothetical protein [Actinomycetota bacterium]
MDPREVARRLAYGRLGIGVGALGTPGLMGRIFFGAEEARRPVSRLLGRLFGIREIVLALASLQSLDRGDDVEGLLRLGVAVDTTDLGAILVAARHVPKRGVVLGGGLAALFAVLGARALGLGGGAAGDGSPEGDGLREA